MAETVMRRVPAPNFISAVGTGVTVAGPTPDGFFHVTFWREGIRITEEHFETTVLPDGATQLKPLANSIRHEMYREEVAKILVPVDKMPYLAQTFAQVVADTTGGAKSPLPLVGASAD